jgi:ketosteroid isomerase-like protein
MEQGTRIEAVMDLPSPTPSEVVDRVAASTNAHDLDALVACFAPDYVNETPAHPSRGFTGREQVRRNWSRIFASIPDVSCEVVARAVDGDRVWSEWEMRGTSPDGSPHHMRGVLVFRVGDGLVQGMRFFLEPVDTASTTADDAVADAVKGTGR